MAAILKKFFKGKHAKDSIHIDREVESRESKRGSRKCNRHERDYESCSTAAYHTESQPRSHRATRSYAAGDISDEEERYEFLNRSLEQKRSSRDENAYRRRGYSKSWRRRCNTSEYGSADPSPTNFMYDPTLDDSESDYIAMEREKRIYELEKKHHEDREKLKGYRERLRIERELREKEIMALKEALRKKKKKDEKDRRDLMNVINNLQSKVNFLEQNQRCGGIFPPLFEGVVGAGESLCTMSASSVPAPAGFSRSTLHNNSDEIDETKNFRRAEVFDAELPRDSASTSSINPEESVNTTLLQNDGVMAEMLSLNLELSSNRKVHSDTDLCRTAARALIRPLQL